MHTVEKKYNKMDTNWYNGKCYDSCKEAGHARLLDGEIEKEKIIDYEYQFKVDFFIEIQDGKPVLVANPDDRLNATFLVRYKVDFKVNNPDGTIDLVEVKGLQGMEWRMKWKMLECVYGNDPNYSLKVIR